MRYSDGQVARNGELLMAYVNSDSAGSPIAQVSIARLPGPPIPRDGVNVRLFGQTGEAIECTPGGFDPLPDIARVRSRTAFATFKVMGAGNSVRMMEVDYGGATYIFLLLHERAEESGQARG
jgi:hypothetical protein